MRKIFSAFIICLFVMSVTVLAEEQAEADNAASKLSRGITNLATCWGEYITQYPTAIESTPDYLTGFAYGIFRGTIFTVRRAAVGLYDTISFPFPGTTHYGPVLEPETVFDPTMQALSD